MVNANSRSLVIILVIAIIVILILALLYAFFWSGTTESNVILDPDGNPCLTLPPPNGVTAEPEGLSKIRVTWDAVATASRYRVFVGTIPGFSKANALTTELTELLEATLDGLVSGRPYFVRIETLNGCNDVGALSEEVETTIGFPTEFKIVNRAQSSLVFGTSSGTGNRITLDPDCQGTDEFCFFTYDPLTKFIKLKTNPAFCLVSATNPPIPDRVTFGPCNLFSDAFKTWEYDDELGSLCHPLPAGGFSCVKVDGLLLPGQDMIITSYDGTNEMTWDIVGV